jgi:hypothetical protein
MKETEDIYRYFSTSPGKGKPETPASLDKENRSVQIIISSDIPILEYDSRTDSMIPTVLLPEGITPPSSNQVPLLDSHNRSTTSKQLGSVRNFKVDGNMYVGEAFYASDKKSNRAFKLVEEGHLTDYSIGASIDRSSCVYLEEDEEIKLHNRTYKGPLKIVQRCYLKEVSSCPIGADENAKNRSKKEEGIMPEPTKVEPEVAPIADQVIEQTARVAQVDEAEVARKAVEAERARLKEVEELCRNLGMDDKFLAQVKELDLSEVKERALKSIEEKNKEVNLNTPVSRVVEASDKFRAGIEEGLAYRTGLFKGNDSTERTDIARQMASFSLLEICREFNALNGGNRYGSPSEVISRALSTSDFANVLGNLGHKQLLESFEAQEEDYKLWADTSGNLANFHIHSKVRAGELGDLVEVKEGAGITYTTRTDQKETVQLASFGKGYRLTRQSIINDDLSELNDAFAEFGESVSRLYGDTAYNQLTTNPTMGDSNALFHANHANLGTQGIISETTIGEAIKLMKVQKDIGGLKRLNIQPQFLLASAKQEAAAEVFFKSTTFVTGSADATRANIYANKFTRIYNPRLDDYDSGDPWFLLGPKGKTVKLFFLNGQMAPIMEKQNDFDTSSVSWKVLADVGAMPVRWEGMVRNTGA